MTLFLTPKSSEKNQDDMKSQKMMTQPAEELWQAHHIQFLYYELIFFIVGKIKEYNSQENEEIHQQTAKDLT